MNETINKRNNNGDEMHKIPVFDGINVAIPRALWYLVFKSTAIRHFVVAVESQPPRRHAANERGSFGTTTKQLLGHCVELTYMCVYVCECGVVSGSVCTHTINIKTCYKKTKTKTKTKKKKTMTRNTIETSYNRHPTERQLISTRVP